MKKLFTLKNLKQKKRRFNLLFFLLIAVLGMNPLTAQIENLPCNEMPYSQFANSLLDNLGVASNAATSWSDLGNVIDGDSNTFARTTFTSDTRHINIRDQNDTYPAGTPIGFNVRLSGVNLVSAGTIRVSTRLGNNEQSIP